jgi:hypothetical protein
MRDGWFFSFRAQEIVKCRIVNPTKKENIPTSPFEFSLTIYTKRLKNKRQASCECLYNNLHMYEVLTKVASKFNCSDSN